MPDLTLPVPEPLPAFRSPVALRMSAAEVLLPPNRMAVSEAATKYRMLHNPGGGYSGPWNNSTVPYMIEPQNTLTDRTFKGLAFVGPAQSAKTDALTLNWITHSVICDPADMLVVEKSEKDARDFSRRRVDRLIRYSKDIYRRLSGDNVFDKTFRGMLLTLGYPTINTLSGKPIPRVVMTDYDRMPEDIEGEGSPFDLAMTRTRTFGSAGMTAAESSPGRLVLKANWKPETPHEAPPAAGILALYNRGDRRRFYWPCPCCGEFFEGSFKNLRWDEALARQPESAALSVYMACPANGCVIEPDHRRSMIAAGRWLIDGQTITPRGEICGTPRQSAIASFWLKGTAAAFSTWADLVEKYLSAVIEFDHTGKEETLKTTTTVDQGEPYLPHAARYEQSVDVEELVERVEPYPLGQIPAGVRFIVAAVDNQVNRFEVLIRGFGENGESWVVDFFTIFQSADASRAVDPALYREDWDMLKTRILENAWPLADGSGRTMPVVALAVDSAGAKGVTAQAYDFYRRQRRSRKAARLLLLKGASTATAPRVAERLPDSKRKDRKAKARGEIPVWFFNANMLKDELDSQLRRIDEGALKVHFSDGLLEQAPPHPFFEQLTAEHRNPDGKWEKIRPRNEAIDLMVMSHVAALIAGLEKIDWSRPPKWAMEPDQNSLIIDPQVPDGNKKPGTGRRNLSKPPRRGSGFVNSWR